MRQLRGFTLIEVMVALVITSLVVTLGYAATSAGFDTEERLTRHRNTAESELVVRSLIGDALRHAVPGVIGGPEIFTLANRVTATGTPVDSLTFATRGIVQPFGATAAWGVSVWMESDGLHFIAVPSAGTPIVATVPGILSLDVRVLGRGVNAQWSESWESSYTAPEGVELFIGGPVALRAPLTARIGFGDQP
jgi:prepilin-type N-terminal cleavage/methylation domain-containing protein